MRLPTFPGPGLHPVLTGMRTSLAQGPLEQAQPLPNHFLGQGTVNDTCRRMNRSDGLLTTFSGRWQPGLEQGTLQGPQADILLVSPGHPNHRYLEGRQQFPDPHLRQAPVQGDPVNTNQDDPRPDFDSVWLHQDFQAIQPNARTAQ